MILFLKINNTTIICFNNHFPHGESQQFFHIEYIFSAAKGCTCENNTYLFHSLKQRTPIHILLVVTIQNTSKVRDCMLLCYNFNSCTKKEKCNGNSFHYLTINSYISLKIFHSANKSNKFYINTPNSVKKAHERAFLKPN